MLSRKKRFLITLFLAMSLLALCGCTDNAKTDTAMVAENICGRKYDASSYSEKYAERVERLQDTVSTYAWPEYRDEYREQLPAYTAAYDEATSKFVSNTDKHGDDCGVFVLIVMRNSGWEPNYATPRSEGQYEWLNNPANGWADVTDTIRSNADARPGDIIITRGKGHVVLFVGEIDGFKSMMVSASYGHRSPMADGKTDIMSYINGTHFSGKKYSVFRKITISTEHISVAKNIRCSERLLAFQKKWRPHRPPFFISSFLLILQSDIHFHVPA